MWRATFILGRAAQEIIVFLPGLDQGLVLGSVGVGDILVDQALLVGDGKGGLVELLISIFEVQRNGVPGQIGFGHLHIAPVLESERFAETFGS